MRLRTKISLKILEAKIWWLRTRARLSEYPIIDPELAGPLDVATQAKLDAALNRLTSVRGITSYWVAYDEAQFDDAEAN